MRKLAPLTKLLLTVFVTIWAILLQSPAILTGILVCQLFLLLASNVSKTVYAGVASLLVFALFLAGLQFAFTADTALAAVTSLKMLAMTLIFFILLATTRMQDLSAALVTQCRVPHEYAFMFTAALRFIPDFLNETKAIQEAQACRGYSPRGNPLRRLTAYGAILKPLVLKAVSRSETMALSLELRGFSNRRHVHGSRSVAFRMPDYTVLAGMAAITCLLVFIR